MITPKGAALEKLREHQVDLPFLEDLGQGTFRVLDIATGIPRLDLRARGSPPLLGWRLFRTRKQKAMPFAPPSFPWKARPGKRSEGKRLSLEKSKDLRRGGIHLKRDIIDFNRLRLLGFVASAKDTVRDAAIGAIEELLTGGAVDDTEGPLPPAQAIPLEDRAGLRVEGQGAIRTRGGMRERRGKADMDSIAATLRHIQTDPMASAHLSQKAYEVLEYLGA